MGPASCPYPMEKEIDSRVDDLDSCPNVKPDSHPLTPFQVSEGCPSEKRDEKTAVGGLSVQGISGRYIRKFSTKFARLEGKKLERGLADAPKKLGHFQHRVQNSCRQKSADPVSLSLDLEAGFKKEPSQNIHQVLHEAEERMYQKKLLSAKIYAAPSLLRSKKYFPGRAAKPQKISTPWRTWPSRG
jgi:hypothetical protein